MPKKVNHLPKIADRIFAHPDREEILGKLVAEVSSDDISEWLCAKYSDNEKTFRFTIKDIDIFRENYFDFYQKMKNDISIVKSNSSVDNALKQEIQGTPQYHKLLEKYVGNEVDIKISAKKMVAAIEIRAAQVFDQIQEDPSNTRGDRILIEWLNLLVSILEKFDNIINGNPENINIQNNINIHIVDKHINVIYESIKDILATLDYDKSLQFIDIFHDKMKAIKASEKEASSQDERIEDAKLLDQFITNKLES